jgi:WD40 repeat protein
MTRKRKTALIFIALTILLLTVFYYHLLYQSKKLNNNIVKLEKVFTAHTADIWTVKFSPAENIVASGGVDSTVKIWKRESGEIIHTLKHPMGVTYLAFRADGKFRTAH